MSFYEFLEIHVLRTAKLFDFRGCFLKTSDWAIELIELFIEKYNNK